MQNIPNFKNERKKRMRDPGNKERRLKNYKGVSHIMKDPAKKI